MGLELIGALLASSGIITVVMSAIKRLNAKIGTLAPAYQQAIVLIMSLVAVKLSLVLGVPVPSDPTAWSAGLVGQILAYLGNAVMLALGAFGIHNVKKTVTS